MNRKYYISICAIILLGVILPGCLEDSLQPDVTIASNKSAELLFLLEERGDYINTTEMPSLITAVNLNNNINNYLVLDIRSSESFEQGHIETSVNINPPDILTFLSANSSINSDIVIVSAAGQSASYYTCLLRLYGYRNAYALKFGMASWNEDFAGIWRNALDAQLDSARMDNKSYPKGDYTSLPDIPVIDSLSDPEQLLQHRISQLFNNTFSESLDYQSTIVSPDVIDNEVSIRTKQFYSDYTLDIPGYKNYYVVCFGPGQIYSPYGFLDKYADLLCHPLSAIYYQDASIRSDFQSITQLQTLPPDKIIAVYSIAGHASAFIAAYLRVLGYNAKSILYGANSFVYSGMFLHNELTLDSFNNITVNNFPYRTGSL